MKILRFFDKRVLIVLGVLILVLLMMDFNNRMGDLSRLKAQRTTLTYQVAQLVQTEQILETQIAYATSDLAVQDYARNDGKMAQTGDVPIVPIAPQGSTPQPTPTPQDVPTVVANWQLWFALFFGQ
jgi:cell division protein FtsB